MSQGRHRRLPRRQLIAARKAIVIVMLAVFTVLSAATFEAGTHGWQFFVDRPAGVGSTPDDEG